VYDRLRRLARSFLARDARASSLQPTDLVHEAYVRLAASARVDVRSRTHFFALAATQMRRILVDHARRQIAAKRGARPTKITLGDGIAGFGVDAIDVLALDQVLERLASESARRARVVELRVFAGLLVEEVAEALEVSERTVKQDWQLARAWLARELKTGRPADGH
jgi:RNA polymerase sigma factor (TIGR02999 family)